jgi:hypothetical protein
MSYVLITKLRMVLKGQAKAQEPGKCCTKENSHFSQKVTTAESEPKDRPMASLEL